MHSARLVRLLVLTLLIMAIPAASFAGVFVSVTVAPPPLPVYVQPPCPQPGYMWTPGYWAWGNDGYYWVPGTWVPAPAVGLLWTPGYWGWSGGYYHWNAGYWGPHIGFYGGVNYGFGYGGVGFVGGEWRGRGFFYNSAVMNVRGAHITNVYVNKTVIVNNRTANRVSYNGGAGGTRSIPTSMERRAAQERHVQATTEQTRHETAAGRNPQLLSRTTAASRPSVPRRDPLTFPPRAQYRPKPRVPRWNPQLGKTGRKHRLRQRNALPLCRVHPQTRHTLRPATTLPSRLALMRMRIPKPASRTRRQPALADLTRKSKRQSIQMRALATRVLFFAGPTPQPQPRPCSGGLNLILRVMAAVRMTTATAAERYSAPPSPKRSITNAYAIGARAERIKLGTSNRPV